MEKEEKELLKVAFNLTEENNKMLHKIRGVQKRQAFFGILKMLFFIGLALGAFYFLQPYVKNIQDFIGSAGDTFNSFNAILPK
ncbi:MAG: hypothetical protein ABH951_00995 [Patescibacteria group bacterium]